MKTSILTRSWRERRGFVRAALVVALLVPLLIPSAGSAQSIMTGISYGAALGTQRTGDFVGATGWRNFYVEGRQEVAPNFTMGFLAGWNVLYERREGLVSIGGVDISGRQNRFVNAIPILLTAHYNVGSTSGWNPYVGLGAGTYWIDNQIEIGITTVSTDHWHFGLAPEVGLFAPPMGPDFRMWISTRYNKAFKSGEISHDYWSFQIGLGSII